MRFTHIQGLLPIHCGASEGLVSTIETLLALDVDGSMKKVLQISDTDQVSCTPKTKAQESFKGWVRVTSTCNEKLTTSLVAQQYLMHMVKGHYGC